MSEIHLRILDKLQNYSDEIQEYVEAAFKLAETLPEASLAKEMEAVVRRIVKAKEMEQ